MVADGIKSVSDLLAWAKEANSRLTYEWDSKLKWAFGSNPELNPIFKSAEKFLAALRVQDEQCGLHSLPQCPVIAEDIQCEHLAIDYFCSLGCRSQSPHRDPSGDNFHWLDWDRVPKKVLCGLCRCPLFKSE